MSVRWASPCACAVLTGILGVTGCASRADRIVQTEAPTTRPTISTLSSSRDTLTISPDAAKSELAPAVSRVTPLPRIDDVASGAQSNPLRPACHEQRERQSRDAGEPAVFRAIHEQGDAATSAARSIVVEEVPAFEIDGAVPTPNVGPDAAIGPATVSEQYPIDLPSALQLAVGQNPQIAYARERIAAAAARYDRAAVQWLPDLVIDPTWTRHDGQIQDTRGDVIQVSRSALFASGGARMHVSTSEAYFAPLAARQVVAARMAASLATTNETLRDVSLAYWDLVRARGMQVVLGDAVRNTERLDELAQSYLRAENLKPADADRVRAQVLARRQELELARHDVRAASSRLARLLQLDPFVELIPADEQPVAVDYLRDSLTGVDLATTALSNRPELSEHRAFVGAAVERLREARLGPVLPSLVVDVSAGGFGGGPNGFFGDFDGRSDVGAAAVWEFENLGFGNRALIRERASQVRLAELSVVATMDRIVAEAAEAAARVEARRNQLEWARQAIASAKDSHDRNLQLFTDSGVELILPLEVLQSVISLTQAQRDYLEVIVENNKAQIQLHWSIGSPVEAVTGI